MTFTPGGPSYGPPAQPTAGGEPKGLGFFLLIGVAVLGVLNLLLGFAPYATLARESVNSFEANTDGLGLLFLGGLLAAASLLPKQSYAGAAAAASVAGWVVALFVFLNVDADSGWGAILILVLGFIQSAVAVAGSAVRHRAPEAAGAQAGRSRGLRSARSGAAGLRPGRPAGLRAEPAAVVRTAAAGLRSERPAGLRAAEPVAARLRPAEPARRLRPAGLRPAGSALAEPARLRPGLRAAPAAGLRQPLRVPGPRPTTPRPPPTSSRSTRGTRSRRARRSPPERPARSTRPGPATVPRSTRRLRTARSPSRPPWSARWSTASSRPPRRSRPTRPRSPNRRATARRPRRSTRAPTETTSSGPTSRWPLTQRGRRPLLCGAPDRCRGVGVPLSRG